MKNKTYVLGHITYYVTTSIVGFILNFMNQKPVKVFGLLLIFFSLLGIAFLYIKKPKYKPPKNHWSNRKEFKQTGVINE